MGERGKMSDTLREEIASELGIYDVVVRAGWMNPDAFDKDKFRLDHNKEIKKNNIKEQDGR